MLLSLFVQLKLTEVLRSAVELLGPGPVLPGDHPDLSVTLERLEHTTGRRVFTLRPFNAL